MNFIKLAVVVCVLVPVLCNGSALARHGGLTDAQVTEATSIDDPAKAVQEFDGQWVAFSIPVLEGTRSPCCWKGKWHGLGEAGCSLEQAHISYGSTPDSPLARNAIVFVRSRDGAVESLRVVGEWCPVDAGGQDVVWIGNVATPLDLDWLENTARSSGRDSARGAALYAMAMHENREAGARLYALAGDPGEELSQESIFWLGENRGSEGLDYLLRLLDDLPRGDARREINFALAQNGSETALEKLVEISRTDADPEQRSGALFWLADEAPATARELLLEMLNSETNEKVIEEAIFAVSQLPAEMGTPMLLALAKDPGRSDEIRRQALFWLANSEDEAAVAALVELLTK